MFNETKNYLKKTAKGVLSSNRMKTMALMFVVGCGAAMAQNSAGGYTAGTTALTQVTEEIVFGKISYSLSMILYIVKLA